MQCINLSCDKSVLILNVLNAICMKIDKSVFMLSACEDDSLTFLATFFHCNEDYFTSVGDYDSLLILLFRKNLIKLLTDILGVPSGL